MHTDLQLLSRYHLEGDAAAFRDLVQAHAGMVFATARRITRDEAMAEDVAQETFFQLARQSRHITQSVAAWLHRVAWRRACNAVRNDATRRRIEEEAAASEAAVRGASGNEATWAEVEAVLDEAVDELPDHLRGPLVMHVLQGRSQRDIAEQIGVNQSTVSRAVDDGLAALRAKLKTRGLLCGAGLAALLMANSSSAAPAALLVSLAKLSMSGIGSTTAVFAGASAASWVKAGIAAMLAAGAVWIVSHRSEQQPNPRPSTAASSVAAAMPAVRQPGAPAAASPTIPVPAALVQPAMPQRAAAQAIAPNAMPTPVHELVHSFPTPPKIPSGHMVKDDDGLLWGTTSKGGHYGMGTLYRMSMDGSVWEEMVSFNGREGLPRGGYPKEGVNHGPDGRLWGMTGDPATIFCYDPRSGQFSTEIAFESAFTLAGCPTILPDGQVWFSSWAGIHRYDPVTRSHTVVIDRGKTVPGNLQMPVVGELTPDGHGWLWAVTCEDRKAGSVCKINLATGEWMKLLTFTGQAGAYPGSYPRCGLTFASDGCFWGCTRNGGETDQGTVFKIHAETGAFTSVAQFRLGKGVNTGINPESMLLDDGRGCMWGTATYGGNGGSLGKGTIFKVEQASGKLSAVVCFTGMDGAAPGGVPRAHLLRAGPDHFVGATPFWGRGWSGVIYRLDISSGRYEVLKHLADVADNNEGEEPHGSLSECRDGSLWGTTHFHGAHHCGTIYRLDPASHQFVTVLDFTGKEGPFPGRNPGSGLVSDGSGWLWGTTQFGGKADVGTIFKLHEHTGSFRCVAEFGSDRQNIPGSGPMTEMVLDERGNLWGSASNTVFKIDARTDTVKTIAVFGGDQSEPLGSRSAGRMAADGRGYVWGCSLADRTRQNASLFRISTADAAFETVEVFPNAAQDWPGWQPSAHMHRDSGGFFWFTGVIGQGGPRPRCSLNRLDPVSGRIVERHFSQQFSIIDTPVEDGHGRLWGAMAMSGGDGSLYTFDLRSNAFQKALEFTGHGSQDRSGRQPMFGRPMRASDGNIYSVTRYGGPGNGGTIYRLRFGPTPMTQEAVILVEGRVELHGVLRPNGSDSEAAFEWGIDPLLKDAALLPAGIVRAGEAAKPVQAVLSGLKRGIRHYFRLRGINPDNKAPQRGAVLDFTIPEDSEQPLEAPLASASAGAEANASAVARGQPQAGASPPSEKFRLRIIKVPGAGAGLVLGWLSGNAYEVGKTYSLTAKADNRYVFANWSGPGISGPAAENPRLDFVFTEELARNPAITVTFVRNPFHPGVLGSYHGLVKAREGVPPGIGTTGALELKVEELGDFTGMLRYDGDELPVVGTFDTGGSARFGDQLAFIGLIQRAEKPVLLISLQIDLAESGPGGVAGHVGLWNGQEAVWQSQVNAMHDAQPAQLADDAVIKHLAESGSLDLELLAMDSGKATPAQLALHPDGRLQFSARLWDETDLPGNAHVSRQSQLSFFHLLKSGERIGSFGIDLPLAFLLKPPDQPAAQGWWLPPHGEAMRPVTLQPAKPEAARQ